MKPPSFLNLSKRASARWLNNLCDLPFTPYKLLFPLGNAYGGSRKRNRLELAGIESLKSWQCTWRFVHENCRSLSILFSVSLSKPRLIPPARVKPEKLLLLSVKKHPARSQGSSTRPIAFCSR